MCGAGFAIITGVNEEPSYAFEQFIQRRIAVGRSAEKALSEAQLSLRRGLRHFRVDLRQNHVNRSFLHRLARFRVMNQTSHERPDAVSALKCELAGEVLRSFGKLHFAATGWSMLPSVWPGETLVIERLTHQHVRVGDVVLVGREGKLCAHRVVSIEAASAVDGFEARLITQGDALSCPDRPVMERELLGLVAYVIRGGKCIPVAAELDMVKSVIAKVIRRSPSAARALVYLNRMRHN
jgi:hypothetical protein